MSVQQGNITTAAANGEQREAEELQREV